MPSIVYGIIGLTIFARMFGLPGIGTETDPGMTIGSTWYDSYYTADGQIAFKPIDSRNASSSAILPGDPLLLVDETDASLVEPIQVPARIVPDGTAGFSVVVAEKPFIIQVGTLEDAPTSRTDLVAIVKETEALNPKVWKHTTAYLSDGPLEGTALDAAKQETRRWLVCEDLEGQMLFVEAPED